jgi:hypothetical protein
VLLIVLPLGLLAMGGIGYWMFYGGARPAVDTYVADVRAKKSGPPVTADADLRATHAIIAASTDLTIKNYATKSSFDKGVGCYWGKLATRSGEVDVAFYVEKAAGEWRVMRASTTKECRCANRGGTCSM